MTWNHISCNYQFLRCERAVPVWYPCIFIFANMRCYVFLTVDGYRFQFWYQNYELNLLFIWSVGMRAMTMYSVWIYEIQIWMKTFHAEIITPYNQNFILATCNLYILLWILRSAITRNENISSKSQASVILYILLTVVTFFLNYILLIISTLDLQFSAISITWSITEK